MSILAIGYRRQAKSKPVSIELASSRASAGTLLAEHAPAPCFALKETTDSLLWVLVTQK